MRTNQYPPTPQAINDDQFQVQMGYYIGTRRKRKKRAKKRKKKRKRKRKKK